MHGPVDKLISTEAGVLPADVWFSTAACIASLLTKQLDLELSLEEIAASQGIPRSSIAPGYVLTFGRVAAAVYRAGWAVLSTAPSTPFLLNDRGATGIPVQAWESFGYFVPLRPTFGVLVGGGPQTKALAWDGSAWRIHLPRRVEAADSVDILNMWTALGAHDQVYGPADVAARAYLACTQTDAHDIELAGAVAEGPLLGIELRQRMNDEQLWQRFARGLPAPTAEDPHALQI